MKIFVVTILFIIISLAIYLSINPSGIVVALNVVSRIRNNITHESIEIENCRWVYNRAGQGEILILLHGFGASKESWNEIIPYLMKNYSIIAIDLPGFGESSKNTNFNYSIDSQVFRLHAFIEQLGLKNFHIAGNSMGGAIAGSYAAKYPSGVKSLWLLDPAGVQSAERSEFEKFFEETGENVMVASSVEEFDRQMAWIYHNPPSIPGYIKRGIINLIGTDRSFSDKLHADLLSEWTPLEVVLAGLGIPVLITWGENDRLAHVSGADVLRGVLPQAEVHLMPNTGHVPMMEYPRATAKQFLDFSKFVSNTEGNVFIKVG